MSDSISIRTIHPDMPFIAAARDILAAHLAGIYVWSAFLPQADRVHEHHQMRIAVKQLRYSLDICQPLMPDIVEATVTALKDLQGILGTLHDFDVLFVMIHDTLTAESPVSRGKRHEAARARAATQRASLETYMSVTAAQREEQHKKALIAWEAMEQRQAFGPLQGALLALIHLPDTVPEAILPTASTVVDAASHTETKGIGFHAKERHT